MCYFPKFSLKETSVLHQPMRPCHHIRVQLSQQYNLKKKKNISRSQLPLLPSRHSFLLISSFTPNLHHRHTNRCSHLFLHAEPPPPPHTATQIAVLLSSFTPNLHHRHTDCPSELTATNFAVAVRGAWKQTEAAVSHDPKVCFSLFSLFPNLDFELGVQIFCLLHRKVPNFEHFLF